MAKNDAALCFIDSNVWLYAFIEGQSAEKSARARQIIEENRPVISIQIINEVCINLIKKAGMPETEIQGLVNAFYKRYDVIETGRELLLMASRLRLRYSFSYWDSLVVSSAILCGAETLFTEDMQNDLIVEDRLSIKNPFATSE